MGSNQSNDADGDAALRPTPPQLSEQDALEIAQQWQAPLYGCVRLTTDLDGPVTSIVESYSWIQINLSEIRRNTSRLSLFKSPDPASIARAAALSWLMVSCCRGYGGQENPSFWRRVFERLRDTTTQGGHSSSVAFFNQPEHIFPRFFLVASDSRESEPYAANYIRAFCGMPGYELEPSLAAPLTGFLSRLRPYMTSDTAYESARVDVCMCMYRHDKNIHDAIDFVRAMNETTRDGPVLSITTMYYSYFCLERDSDVAVHNLTWSVSLPAMRLWFDCEPLIRMTAAEKAEAVAEVLGLGSDGRYLKPTTITFFRVWPNQDRILFSAIASALPFLTTAHSIDLAGNFDEQSKLTWSAYAIFHPEAKNSSLRNLTLFFERLMPDQSEIWSAMARGNNLLALLNGTPATSTMYCSARLSRGSVVKVAASWDAAPLVIVSEHDDGRMVDVCGVSSLDTTTWNPWVPVVVPACGLGWVRSKELRDMRSRPSSVPALQGLRMRCDARWSDLPAMATMIRGLGASLKYLNIKSYPDVPSSTLHQVLCACPQLTVLAVKHDGEYWSSSGPCCPSRLEELELIVPHSSFVVKTPSMKHLQTSLCQLRTLRVDLRHEPETTQEKDMQVKQNHAALEQFLRYGACLQYIHWRVEPNHWNLNHYESSSEQKRAKIQHNQLMHTVRQRLSKDTLLYVQVPVTPTCAAAFISAISSTMTSRPSRLRPSAMASLCDRDVLTNIFCFATSPVLRELHLGE